MRRSMFGTGAEASWIEASAARGADEGIVRAGLATAGAAVSGSVGSEGAADATGTPDPVERPAHYTAGSVECIDAIRSALGMEGFEAYCRGNVLKYVWRAELKGGAEDYRKARRYLDWLIEAEGA